MIKKYLLLTLAAFLLTACGGSSSSDKSLFDDQSSAEEGATNDATDEAPEDSDVSTGTDIENPRLGTGTEAAFDSGSLALSLTELSAGGTTRISANIVDRDNDNKKIVSQSYTVAFSSSCSEEQPAKAEFNNPEVTTASGSVSVIYTAKGCTGTDTISARLLADEQHVHTATAEVSVEQAELGAITFFETESPALSISTMANKQLPESTTVSFKVLDKLSNPIPEKKVTFEVTNTAGGVSLAKTEGLTDNDGVVSAMLLSGSTHLITQVKATTLANDGVTELSTSSLPVSITTGLPRQDRVSISLETFNPAAFNFDGATVGVTFTASDAFGNDVPNGTVINFTTESGAMASSCKTEGGQCSVDWKSGGTRPGEYDPALNLVNEQVGMTTILAYTLGEAGFTDSNGNNTFDVNEPFVSFAEPFRDDNWNASLDTDATSGLNVEQFIDTNQDGSHTAAGSKYQGSLCSEASIAAGHCESLMHVRAQTRLVQSLADSINMSIFECSGTPEACTDVTDTVTLAENTDTPPVKVAGEFLVVLQDANGNIPEHEATFNVEGDGYKITGQSGDVGSGLGELNLDFPAGNGLPKYGKSFLVQYKPEDEPVDITLKATSGTATLEYTIE